MSWLSPKAGLTSMPGGRGSPGRTNHATGPSLSTPSPASPSLALQLGNIQLSVGGPAGTGVYRTPEREGGPLVAVQTEGLRDGVEGIRDGMRNLFGKGKEGVERGLGP